MKNKTIKLKYKKETIEYNLTVFESLKEAVSMVGEEEVFNCFNLGNYLASRKRVLGKDPFFKRRKKVTIDISKLDKNVLNQLKHLGLLPVEE